MLRHLLKFPKICNDAAVALLFPTQCRVCAVLLDALDDGVACQRCWQAAEAGRLNFDYCVKCDASLPRLQLQTQGRRCGHCNEFAFTAARAGGIYRGAIRESVLQLKVHPELSAQLRCLLA
ncbi:MAG TPA: hypothetical protein VFZ34_27560, partial [Blastocatellia bacterium]|nr:hypothetical protein [Blastocatellia bacterium]